MNVWLAAGVVAHSVLRSILCGDRIVIKIIADMLFASAGLHLGCAALGQDIFAATQHI
jgi:hypothetical protein